MAKQKSNRTAAVDELAAKNEKRRAELAQLFASRAPRRGPRLDVHGLARAWGEAYVDIYEQIATRPDLHAWADLYRMKGRTRARWMALAKGATGAALRARKQPREDPPPESSSRPILRRAATARGEPVTVALPAPPPSNGVAPSSDGAPYYTIAEVDALQIAGHLPRDARVWAWSANIVIVSPTDETQVMAWVSVDEVARFLAHRWGLKGPEDAGSAPRSLRTLLSGMLARVRRLFGA